MNFNSLVESMNLTDVIFFGKLKKKNMCQAYHKNNNDVFLIK